jgi:hypothetical protein
MWDCELTSRIVVRVVRKSEIVVCCHGAGHVAETQLQAVRTRRRPNVGVREQVLNCNTHATENPNTRNNALLLL